MVTSVTRQELLENTCIIHTDATIGIVAGALVRCSVMDTKTHCGPPWVLVRLTVALPELETPPPL